MDSVVIDNAIENTDAIFTSKIKEEDKASFKINKEKQKIEEDENLLAKKKEDLRNELLKIEEEEKTLQEKITKLDEEKWFAEIKELEEEQIEVETTFADNFKSDYIETIGHITENANSIEKAATEKILEMYTAKNIFTQGVAFDENIFSDEEKKKLDYYSTILLNIAMYRTQDTLLEFLVKEKIVREVAENPTFLIREYDKLKRFKRRKKIHSALSFEYVISIATNNIDNEKYKHLIAFCYCLLRYLNHLDNKKQLELYLTYAILTSAVTSASVHNPRPFYTDLFEKLEKLESNKEKKVFVTRTHTVSPPKVKNKKKSSKNKKRGKR